MRRVERAVCVWFALAMIPALALAQDANRAEAEKHFKAGLALFRAEKYEAALVELETSARLYPTKGGLFNLVSAYKVLSRYDDALDTIARLETEYGAKMDDEMRSAVAGIKAEIQALAARLEVVVEPPGASVTVDGRDVGKSPLRRPLLVDPGTHVVRAALEGRAPAEASVKVVSGQKERVSLSLAAEPGAMPVAVAVPSAERAEPEPVEEPPPAAEEPPKAAPMGPPPAEAEPETEPAVEQDQAEEDEGLSPVWFWVGLGATAALGGATIAMDLVVGEAKDEVTDAAEQEDALALRNGGIALFALTCAAAVTTAALGIAADWGGREGGEKKAASPAVGWWMAVTPEGAGAGVEGRF